MAMTELSDIDLLALEVARQQRPRLTEREARHELVDVVIRCLYYQENGEPDWSNMSADQHVEEWSTLRPSIFNRYRNDSLFHAQVDRMVHAIWDIQHRTLTPEQEKDYHARR